MLKYIGIVFLLAGLVGVYSSYRAYTERRLSELSAFIKLISGLKDEIELYSRPLGRYLSSFRECALENAGVDFSGSCAEESYRRARGSLSVGESADETLLTFFSSVGSGGRGGEVARCERTVDKLRAIEEEERIALGKNRTSVGAIFAAVGLTVTILVI